jgi:putative membrane protein
MDVMFASKAQLTLYRSALVTKLLLLWYITFFLAMAVSPVDRKTWLAANVLPVFFVATLALTHKAFPLSNQSYLLITVWLTLHTVAVHYTYPKVPLGFWLEHWLDFHRNHFDRVVHFSFGFLLAYPLEEIFRRVGNMTGWLLPYVVVMTILGFSAFWEIIEAWVGQIAHPDLEMAFVGHQGDVWDPQRDIAAALYGAILCVAFMAVLRWLREPIPAVETASASSEALGDL